MQFTKERKQLFILIITAAWIVMTLFVASYNTSYFVYSRGVEGRHTEFRIGALIVQTLVWSSPALLFGGISLWWVRRK